MTKQEREERVLAAIRGLDYGTVTVVVQASAIKTVRTETVEKLD